MTGFYRDGAALVCDGVPLDAIAAAEGTPLYVYSAATIAGRYRAIDAAFGGYPARDPLRAEGELDAGDRAPAARARQQRRRELRRRDRGRAAAPASRRRRSSSPASARRRPSSSMRSCSACAAINVESDGELERIEAIARERKVAGGRDPRQPRHRREEPSAHLHRPEDQQVRHRRSTRRGRCARARAAAPDVEIVGLHVHVGSQITDLEPLRRAAAALVGARRASCAATACRIEHLDIGGGLGVSYDGGAGARRPRDYAAALLPVRARVGPADRPRAGPARSSAPAGRAARARRRRQARSRGSERLFVVIDAGMTELMRPMLYGAFHRIEPVVLSDAPTTSRRHRRPGLREQRHAGPRPHAAARRRSATWSRSATPAPTDR